MLVKSSRLKSGYSTLCRSCSSDISKKNYTKNKDKILAKNKAWSVANKEKLSAIAKAWVQKNRDKVNRYAKTWREKNLYAAREYRKENPEKVKAGIAQWRAANPGAKHAYSQNRRARKVLAGGKLSRNLAEKLYKLQRGKCACCGELLGDDYHLDHIMPLALGGSNTDDNMQLLRAICNRQKSAKHPVDFMQSRGFLL